MNLACAWIATLAIGCAAHATGNVDSLTTAQTAYERGVALKAEGKPEEARAAFAESAREYRAVVATGAENPGIHFNLANASVQSGELGRGIASYLRALRLAPHDRSVAANLATARSDVRTKLADGGTDPFAGQFAWWRAVSERTRGWFAVGSWIAFWTLCAVGISGVRVPPSLRRVRDAALAVALIVGGTVAFDRWIAATRTIGVITADGVVLRKGNGDGFAPQVEESLSNGVEFRVLEQRPQWLRVRLSDGTEGWIRESQSEIA